MLRAVKSESELANQIFEEAGDESQQSLSSAGQPLFALDEENSTFSFSSALLHQHEEELAFIHQDFRLLAPVALLDDDMTNSSPSHSSDDFSKARSLSSQLSPVMLRYPTPFHWTEGGNQILLAGSFTSWQKGALEMKQEDSNLRIFSITVDLLPGIYSYKFIVDGEWRYASDQSQITDPQGNINNCVSITRVVKASDIPQKYDVAKIPTFKSHHHLLYNQLLLPGVQEIPRRPTNKMQKPLVASSTKTFQLTIPTSSTRTPSVSSTGSLLIPELNTNRDISLKTSESPSVNKIGGSNSHKNNNNNHSLASPSLASASISIPQRPSALSPEQVLRQKQKFISQSLPSNNNSGNNNSSRSYNPLLDSDNRHDPSILTFAYGASPGSGHLSILNEERPRTVGEHRLMLAMVGLPARGKSVIARKLCRYLNWMGFKSKVFNLGDYRRVNLGSFHSHDFFRPDNVDGLKTRNSIALVALDDVIRWFNEDDGVVAIFDGTNSTSERRKMILERLKMEKPNLYVKTIFVEVICNNEDVIEANIRATKLSSPDYVGVDPSKIVEDFLSRIEHYKSAYETLGSNDDYHYIKIFEVGKQLVANRITGFVPSRVMFYLSNLHITPRPIYLVRHGQSMYNLDDRLGGDSPLTQNGLKFTEVLREWVSKEISDPDQELCLWSSTMTRAVQTAEVIPCAQYVRWKIMEEINVGICDGMTYGEVENTTPEEFKARNIDKLRYRYPRGESYEDVIRRLEPVIIELERQQKPIFVVGHRAVLRCLYGYLMDKTREEVPHLSIPLHTVIKLEPSSVSTKETRFKLMAGTE